MPEIIIITPIPPAPADMHASPPMTEREELAAAAARVRSYLAREVVGRRAWFERNGHPVPEVLIDPDDEVGCWYGCPSHQRAEDGSPIPLLFADLDKLVGAIEMEVDW